MSNKYVGIVQFRNSVVQTQNLIRQEFTIKMLFSKNIVKVIAEIYYSVYCHILTASKYQYKNIKHKEVAIYKKMFLVQFFLFFFMSSILEKTGN